MKHLISISAPVFLSAYCKTHLATRSLPVHKAGSSKPRSWGGLPTLGHGAPGAWLTAAEVGPFHYLQTRVPSSSSSFIPEQREPWPSASVADGLRAPVQEGETPKHAAEPWSAAASQGLVVYKTPRGIFDCPGTKWLYPVSARCDFYLQLLT